MALTADHISNITGANKDRVSANWPLILAALDWAGINLPLVQIGMAATLAIETANFEPIKERRAKPAQTAVFEAQSKYWDSGYMGRGYIQLTWKKNYIAAGDALGVDLAGNPDLAMRPDIAAKIAAWFFRQNYVHKACEKSDWATVRRLVNGPNFHKDEAGWARFYGWCIKLTEAAR